MKRKRKSNAKNFRQYVDIQRGFTVFEWVCLLAIPVLCWLVANAFVK